MESSRILIFLIGLALVLAGNNQKSSKKGLVISNWKNHMVGDFEPFNTVSWWYNYHTYKEVWDQVPWWCHYEDGSVPKNKTLWWFSVGICKYKPGYKSHDLL